MNSLKSFFLFSYFLTFLACTSAQYRAVDYNTVIDHDGAYAIELDLKNETLSPTASPTTVPNPSSRPGNKHSRIIIGYIFQAVTLLTFLFAIITFRKEIYSGIRSGQCLRRSNRNDEEGSLNDIIFDPEEEQAASLSESLLPASSNQE